MYQSWAHGTQYRQKTHSAPGKRGKKRKLMPQFMNLWLYCLTFFVVVRMSNGLIWGQLLNIWLKKWIERVNCVIQINEITVIIAR